MRLDTHDHRALARWAAECAAHVLPLFEERAPDDNRPQQAIAAAHAWARGEIEVGAARTAAFGAHAAAREASDPAAQMAARAAGHAAATAHMAAHARHAAAYAVTAVRDGAQHDEAADDAAATERAWQVERLPVRLRPIGMPDGGSRQRRTPSPLPDA